jgi:hypothetical protein
LNRMQNSWTRKSLAKNLRYIWNDCTLGNWIDFKEYDNFILLDIKINTKVHYRKICLASFMSRKCILVYVE